jgi:hypothetical protein
MRATFDISIGQHKEIRVRFGQLISKAKRLNTLNQRIIGIFNE